MKGVGRHGRAGRPSSGREALEGAAGRRLGNRWQLLHDDFVQEWPQSGERIIGRDNAIAIEQSFPGGLPTMRFRRTLADGDLAVLEVELTYADGSRYLGASILELRDGKVVRETDYYAQPFQAPEWRAQWVERT